MTVLEQVEAILEKISPAAICDDCLAKALGLSVRQHANHKTRELAVRRGYWRAKAPCSHCHAEKLVIVRNRPR